jgi:hypothetical protein
MLTVTVKQNIPCTACTFRAQPVHSVHSLYIPCTACVHSIIAYYLADNFHCSANLVMDIVGANLMYGQQCHPDNPAFWMSSVFSPRVEQP